MKKPGQLLVKHLFYFSHFQAADQMLPKCQPLISHWTSGLVFVCIRLVQERTEEEKRISEGHGSKSALNRFALRSYQSLFATSCYRCLEGTIFIC